MKEAVLDFPRLETIRQTCGDVELDAGSRLMILTAPVPECIMASVLLSTAVIRGKGTFHITYAEPVYSAKKIRDFFEGHPRSSLALIGVTPDKNIELDRRAFALGVSNTYSSSVVLGRQGEETLAAYALASEKLQVGTRELKLALAGTLATYEEKGDIKEILDYCKKEDIADTRKGFLLFGSNFLPLIEALEYSMFPYLPQLSGDRQACENLLDESDIPLRKRGVPILDLNTTEQQNLSANLIPLLDSRLISEVFGQDFEFLDEKSNSPMRFFSNMIVLLKTAWIRNRYGLGAAVCFGDRAQQLRLLRDDSLELAKRSLETVPQMMAAINEAPDMADNQMAQLDMNVGTDVLSVLGMIAVQNRMFESDFLLLGNQSETQLVWKTKKYSLKSIMMKLHEGGIEASSTCYSSVRVDRRRENIGDVLRKTLSALVPEKGKIE